MFRAAAASSETTALLPASSPEGDSISTRARVSARVSRWRFWKYSRRAVMLALESGVAILRFSRWDGPVYPPSPYRRLSSLRLTRSLNFLLWNQERRLDSL